MLRDGGTSYLELAVRVSGHAKMLVPKLKEALAATGATEIVDLCSGGGGPVRIVAEELAAQGQPVTVRLTDFYPNLPAFKHVAEGANGRISFEEKPVDATAVPASFTGFRTIFNVDFTNPFPWLMDRSAPLHVAIGADPFRAIPPPDENVRAALDAVDVALVPTCPVTNVNQTLLSLYLPSLETAHSRITLTSCYDAFIRNSLKPAANTGG